MYAIFLLSVFRTYWIFYLLTTSFSQFLPSFSQFSNLIYFVYYSFYVLSLFAGEDDQEIVRVVHCGDAPGDVLAAKYCMEHNKFDDGVAVSCIAVATGRFTAEHLSSLFGDSKSGIWEPVVLEKGLADPSFIDACKIGENS